MWHIPDVRAVLSVTACARGQRRLTGNLVTPPAANRVPVGHDDLTEMNCDDLVAHVLDDDEIDRFLGSVRAAQALLRDPSAGAFDMLGQNRSTMALWRWARLASIEPKMRTLRSSARLPIVPCWPTSTPANKPPSRAFANRHAVPGKSICGEQDDKQASDPVAGRKYFNAKRQHQKRHGGPDDHEPKIGPSGRDVADVTCHGFHSGQCLTTCTLHAGEAIGRAKMHVMTSRRSELRQVKSR